ncbi:MAG: aminodeoxychorismate/anthranilate synthase component II [Syntrophobacterales bacterium]|nr:aminodeoxychorismate/anthranilate synthase component II [Syntrophobacterales bacterium]
MRKLLMIDNYDSFTFNLFQLFASLGVNIEVFRHDEITIGEIERKVPRWICISPGPKNPVQAGISKEVIGHFYTRVPILGVCLGMQAINEVFGGKTVHAPRPVHGKRDLIYHTGVGIFQGVPSPFWAARYHSLCVSPVSQELIITAWSQEGVIMGLQHCSYPLHGVQFHPESFMTEYGKELILNFLLEG